jgi:glutathione synthase/RimK-type ligase-like ATP-grasp enzyme
MRSIVVVNNPSKDWELNINDVEVISAKAYLTESQYAEMKNVRIFNLCRSYRYQSIGYYVSLIAEARGHKAVPSMITMQDIRSPALVRIVSDDLEELIQKSLTKLKSSSFTLSVYFGKSVSERYEKLATQLSNLFPAPLLRASFSYNNTEELWTIQSVTPIAIKDIPSYHLEYAREAAKAYFAKKRFHTTRQSSSSYNLGILVNPEEKTAPSDKKALQKFIQAAESLGMSTELITKDDFSRIAEFDALFIRETTNVNHHTYRFSRCARAEGLVVIDDPESILKCANKVYLTEMLTKAKIGIPKTLIVHKDNRETVEEQIGLPCVLKIPDGAFSKGVVKVHNKLDLQERLDEFLEESDLILAQEFVPTDFDWRIGILDKQPLYACKYYMAKDHWQIYNWGGKKSQQMGAFDNVPIDKVPEKVLKTALRAANLIGNGMYGVDLKECKNDVLIIEINDNPSIDSGVEDSLLGNKLYTTIMQCFLNRIIAQKKSVVDNVADKP